MGNNWNTALLFTTVVIVSMIGASALGFALVAKALSGIGLFGAGWMFGRAND